MALNYSVGPEDGADIVEARREALKRFSRYAAAAPAAMLLLEPHQGHAAQHRGKVNKQTKPRVQGPLGGRGTPVVSNTPAPSSGGYH